MEDFVDCRTTNVIIIIIHRVLKTQARAIVCFVRTLRACPKTADAESFSYFFFTLVHVHFCLKTQFNDDEANQVEVVRK